MNVAVVGAGIFGTTISWLLSKEGYKVDLFEKNSDILMAASTVNQYRLHKGYHYPRSMETIVSCLKGEKEFRKVYAEAVIDSFDHFYPIANQKGLSTADQCLKVWDDCELEYEVVDLDLMKKDKIEVCLKVKESLFNPNKFKEICLSRLKEYSVNLQLGNEVFADDLKQYDLVVIATYSLNNSLLSKYPEAQRDYQFELIEKPVLELSNRFANKSIVVIDGPFMCIDPLGKTGYFLMGNVVHAIHEHNTGRFPNIPEEFKNLINNNIIRNPPITKIKEFIESASEYFYGMEDVKHVGSMYTVRTVLPYREHDDARPTIVEQINSRIVTVFSGKIPTCIDAAKQTINIAKKMERNGY
jgi:hypothetical protein